MWKEKMGFLLQIKGLSHTKYQLMTIKVHKLFYEIQYYEGKVISSQIDQVILKGTRYFSIRVRDIKVMIFSIYVKPVSSWTFQNWKFTKLDILYNPCNFIFCCLIRVEIKVFLTVDNLDLTQNWFQWKWNFPIRPTQDKLGSPAVRVSNTTLTDVPPQ